MKVITKYVKEVTSSRGLLLVGKDVKARGVWLKFKGVIVGRKGCEGKRYVVKVQGGYCW